MDIQASKIKLVQIILNIDDDQVIKKLMDFVNENQDDFWGELSLKQKNEIKKGVDQLNNGKRKPYSEVINGLSWCKFLCQTLPSTN